MMYDVIYDQLIVRARARIHVKGNELHHVVPLCIGGSDDVVSLTCREHVFAHMLLVRMYPDVPQLLLALKFMNVGSKYHSRISRRTGVDREKMIEAQSSVMKLYYEANPRSDETRQKLSNSVRRYQQERLATDAERAEQSKKLKSYYASHERSADIKARMSMAVQAVKKLVCCHCGKSAAPWNMKRWHDDNCKQKKFISR